MQREHSSPRVSVGYCRLSHLPQYVPATGGAPTAGLPTPAFAADLRMEPGRAPQRSMVYCVGCAYKANGGGLGEAAPAEGVSWMQAKFASVLSTLGLGGGEDEAQSAIIARAASGRGPAGGADADEAEVMAAVGAVRRPAAPQPAPMTMVWPALSLLLGGAAAADPPTDEPAVQSVWFALCDTCWGYLRPGM